MSKVLVCGGRSYGNVRYLWGVLNVIKPTCVGHGGAKGGDGLAAAWAKAHRVEARAYPADWEKHGKAAGPIRNLEMLTKEKPAMALAFSGGRGTADCVAQARSHGIIV